MPYCSQIIAEKPVVSGVNYYPGGQSGPYTDLQWTYHTKGNSGKMVNRGGTSYNTGKLSKAQRVSRGLGRYILVSVKDYRHAIKLKEKVWSPQQMRMVYRKIVPTIQRYKFVPTKAKRSKGFNLAPNALAFTEISIANSGSDSVSAIYNPDPRYYRSYSGALYGDFMLIGYNSYVSGQYGKISGVESHDATKELIRNIDNGALTSLYEKIKGQTVNIGCLIAERQQTLNMFMDAVKRVSGMILAVKRGNVNKALKSLFPQKTLSKNVSDLWLVNAYGIQPLLSDIDGMAAYLGTPQKMRFSIRSKKTEKIERKLVGDFQDGNWCRTKIYLTVEVTVKYKCELEVQDEGFTRGVAQLGLGNPLSVLWEIMPWSFVIDWALPIGNYLNNLDAFTGIKLISTTKTTYSKEFVEFDRQFGGTDNNGYTWTGTKAWSKINRVKCNREILTNIPQLPYPEFKDPLSRGHFANALALLAQRIRK